MSAFDPATEPYLQRALDGVQLIEASAGTGKTFTLATLFTRLVVEQGLRIGQVLAVTYTEAATQELRKRIRERLALAARLVTTPPAEGESQEMALTRHILDQHLAAGGESAPALARRLRLAAEEADLAAIFTIHGFCARVLRERALETGQGFAAPELLTDTQTLHAEVAADLWRVHARSEQDARLLAALWSSPEAMAQDLPVLAAELPLLPPEPHIDPAASSASRQVREVATARLRAAIDTGLDEARAQVATAFERKVFNGQRAKRPSFDKAFEELRAGAGIGEWPRTDKSHLQKLLPDTMLDFCREGQQQAVPSAPLFDALRDWCVADDAWRALQQKLSAAFLHRLRAQARERLDRLKRERRLQTYDDLIECVARALEGPHRQALVARLREQYKIALVDEFQDTDNRQWRIFERVFGVSAETAALGLKPVLFLIGDPKQAIYGFRGGDVATYLVARGLAEPAPPLARNFRSRPAVLRAIQALYDAAAAHGLNPFVQPDIAFEPVLPGGRRDDADYLRHDAVAPALTLRWLPAGDDGKPLKAEDSRAALTAACVAHVHAVLADARAGRARIGGRPVQPGDIAVLVRNHRQATQVQQALARAGVPAVAAGKQSLFASAEAAELRSLLLALLQPADGGRLRAALATVLLGMDAAAIAALEADDAALRACQAQLLGWRTRLQQGGPLALLAEVCAEQAERLLGLLDGERRLTNYLQLAELLQEASAKVLGLHGLLDWLQVRIARADDGDEAQLLRLESDARRVQILTLHKSKGLEYPLVYLPFVGLHTDPPRSERHRRFQTGDGRVLQWKLDKDDVAWKAAGEAVAAEARAEDARLLYVGLTRAGQALWIGAGAVAGFSDSPLAPLLADPQALAADPSIVLVHGPAEPPPPRLPAESGEAIAQARRVLRRIAPDWWVYSFTQLARAQTGGDPMAADTQADAGGADEAPAEEATETGEPAAPASAPAAAVDPRFAGSRFGVVMHAALENADFPAWRGWRGSDPAPAGQGEVIAAALRGEGYAEADIADGLDVLVPLVGHTLTVGLPEGGRLADLPGPQRRNEMEFHFAMNGTRADALLALLHRHGLLRGRQGFGARQRLEGLMTGLIDLTYIKDGRWYVLDYKSNRLPVYDARAMEQAMTHSEYDLQALLYTLALHRWLRFRLGDGYDYARDFGGVRYLFCRGLDAADPASPGVRAWRFEPELVAALDALFAGRVQAEAVA